MRDKIQELEDIAKKCEDAADEFESLGFDELTSNFEEVIRSIGRSASGSWLGYHADIYYKDFNVPPPGDTFDRQWGFKDTFSNTTSQNWRQYSRDGVKNHIFEISGIEENTDFGEKAYETGELFSKYKNSIVVILNVILEELRTETMEGYRDEISKLKSHIPQKSFISHWAPKGNILSNDMIAFTQGIIAPPHVESSAFILSLKSYFKQIKTLAEKTNVVVTYLRQKYQGETQRSTTDGRIFIGHGRSLVWKELSEFLNERLRLQWDEFNRESAAGISITDRLGTMLDQAGFAFLIMTAEDEHIDNTTHARENVIHEIGLFQGRLGFKRAIILLEEGCEEFSNIHGIGQIRFSRGRIRTAFEDIRMVLEREGFIQS